MSNPVTIIAFYFEDGKIILLDPAKQEYECASPQQLWDDMHAIANDKALPHAQASSASEDITADPEAMYELACEQVEEVVGAQYGPVGRAVIGKVARAGGPTIFRALRNISRRKRSIGG